MRKIYIIPETEQLSVIKETPLCAGSPTINASGDSENYPSSGGGGGSPTYDGPGAGGQNDGPGGFGARQHNNWMWDTMEDGF